MKQFSLSNGILNTDGNIFVQFPDSLLNHYYYISINQRNSIESWSSKAVLFNSKTSYYDLTKEAKYAYGNNLINLGDGNFAIWSGDLSDITLGVGIQDGVVESQDYSDMENAVYFTLLGYVVEDITGDGVVESSDYSLMENNVYYTIVSIHP